MNLAIPVVVPVGVYEVDVGLHGGVVGDVGVGLDGGGAGHAGVAVRSRVRGRHCQVKVWHLGDWSTSRLPNCCQCTICMLNCWLAWAIQAASSMRKEGINRMRISVYFDLPVPMSRWLLVID